MTANIKRDGASPARPTLEAVERRRRELLARQAGRQAEPEPTEPTENAELTEPTQITEPTETPIPLGGSAWPTPAPAALYGLAGLAVRTIVVF